MADKVNRWKFVYAALVMQLCLGVLYSWSVFRGPLEATNGWSKGVSIAPYRYSVLFFTVSMIIAGFWQDKQGPRLVGSVGGALMGTGCVKWFPDKRGTIVGLAVLGFGAGSLIFAPLIERLLGTDPAMWATTIPRTFMILSVIFFICVIGAAQVYAVPPAGWKPEGWSPPAAATTAAGAVAKAEFAPGDMVKTWQFFALWCIYFLGTTAVMTGGTARGIMSAFNGVGRLAWGATSDKIGRKNTTICMFVGYIIACMFLLRNVQNFNQALAGLCVVGFCYGGYLAMMPSFTADFYGAKNVGANYGIVFTAWGVCGFTVPGYFAKIVGAAKAAGDVSAGYNQVYFTLAGMCVLGIILVVILRKPALAE